MSSTDLETLNTQYVSAVDAENWAAALKILSKISVRIATMPSEISKGLGGGGMQSIKWNSQMIAEQQSFCMRMKAAALAASGSGYQQVPVTYKRATATGDYS